MSIPNYMTWNRPPTDGNELMLWKSFCASCEADVWKVVCRWVKCYGNPFGAVVDYSDYEAYERHTLFQQAIQFTYRRK